MNSFIGGPELLVMMLLSMVLAVVPFVIGYWVIRLAVRHGVLDAQRQMSGPAPFDRS